MKRLFALLLSVFVGLLVGEFIVRVREEAGFREAWASIWDSEDRVPTSFGAQDHGMAPDPELSFTYNPNQPDVNSLGIKAPEIAAKDPKGPMRIIVLGDSVAAPRFNEPKDNWVAMIGEQLRGRAEVINAAIIGYTIYQERLLLDSRLLSRDPDLVVLQYALNDNARFLHRFDKEVAIGLLLTEQARRDFVPIEGDPLAWQEDSWEFVKEQLAAIQRSVESIGDRLAVAAFPFVPQFDEELVQSELPRVLYPQRRMSKICEEMEIPLHDLYPLLADHGGAELFADLAHLNPDGHRLVADEMVRYLEEGALVTPRPVQAVD